MRTAKRAAGILSLFLILFLSGCRIGDFYFSPSLFGTTLAAGRFSSLTVSEANLLFMDCQSRYNSWYGSDNPGNFWEEEVSGLSFSEYLRESRMKNEICALLILLDIAKERKISLSEEEKSACRQAAVFYYSGLTGEEKAYCKASERDAVSLFEKYRLAEKTIHALMDGAYLEISDNDKRVITLWVICTQSLSEAEALKEQLDNGADFLQKAKDATLLPQVEYQISRGDLNPALEEVAFYLRDQEISDVISCKDAFYIIKCVEDYDENLSRSNESSVYNRLRYEQWSREVLAYASKDAIGIADRLWKSFRFGLTDQITAGNLFDCYREYLKPFS